MTKKRKRSTNHTARRLDDLPWKTVDTAELPEPTNALSNHYDVDESSPQRQRRRQDELEANPGESVAMFFGLQVLSGDDYTVNSHGKLEAKKDIDEKRAAEASCEDERESFVLPVGANQKPKAADGAAVETVSTAEFNKQNETDKGESEQIKKKKRKKKKRKKKTAQETPEDGGHGADEKTNADTPADSSCNDDDDEVQRMQTAWMVATGGVTLHPTLCASLLSQQFWTPTPIQSATLASAILGRRNIVGAAPTGSGKTLAYLLPILQSILSQAQDITVLQALVLTPTRELALQVSRECNLLLDVNGKEKWCATIVGGLALAKQQRVLEKNKPRILVATPGRLWEMMASRQHEHLTNLSQLKFLVIDEADRMIGQGSFLQLVHIFNAIHQANPLASDDDDEGDFEDDDDEHEEDLLQSLPGVRGEARVEMLGDVLERMRHDAQGLNEEPEPLELNDDEYNELQMQQHEQLDDEEHDSSLAAAAAAPPVQRQTFVYSATLTLPPSASYVAKATKSNKKKGKAKKAVTVDGAIAEIMEKARASGQTKVVDLTSADKRYVLAPSKREESQDRTKESSSSRLPPGLSLYKIECTQRHKDSHLYAYLVTTAQGASGPCLVFCNSIAAVRRVGATLQALRLPVRMLHASMAQKARLKAVESLQEPRSIVVATDVAARGLDIPSVATVVHYDVARQVDTFIHRAGRTARGMGKAAVGSSLSLISPGEDKTHAKVCEALHSKHLFQEVNMDGRLLAAAQERANLAAKIVECNEVETKAQKSNKWFQEAAEQAGLDLDDDMMDEGLAGGDQRDQHKLREAKAARARLRHLLAQPMQTQRFGKFLSSNSAAAIQEVKAHVVPLTSDRKKNKKRKGKQK